MSFASSTRASFLLCLLLCIACILPSTNGAGVSFTRPGSGGAYPPGQFIVNWTDAGGNPNIAQLTTYELLLIVGGNYQNDSKTLATLSPPGALVQDGGLVTEIAADVSQSIQNGFYLSMVSNVSGGGQIINYSDRFTLIELNGTLEQEYIEGAASAPGAGNVPGAVSVPAPAATSSSASSTSAPTSAASSTSSSIPSSNSGSTHLVSSGELAGLAIGSLCAIVLLLVLLALLVYWWRKRRREQKLQQAREAQEMDDVFGGATGSRGGEDRRARRATPLVELSPDPERFEAMEADKRFEADSEIRYELEGDWAGWEASTARHSQMQAYDPTR